MLIRGLQKLSLVDYPGRISAVIFTQGCNFTCPYCQNPDLVGQGGEAEYTEEEILAYLAKRKIIVTGLVMTGGEPIIQNGLTEFIDKVRDIGIKVKLDTNGSNPLVLAKLINGKKLDYIAVDVKTSLAKYHLLAAMKNAADLVKESVKITMAGGIPYEFRTTCVPGIVEKEDILSIAEEIKGAEKWRLQQFRPRVTLDKNFSEVKPYPKETLEEFKNAVFGHVKKVELSGV